MFLELFQSNFILLKYISWHYHHHTAYKIQYKSFTSAFKVLQNRILSPSQFYFLYLNKLDCIPVLQTCINHTHLFPSSLLSSFSNWSKLNFQEVNTLVLLECHQTHLATTWRTDCIHSVLLHPNVESIVE